MPNAIRKLLAASTVLFVAFSIPGAADPVLRRPQASVAAPAWNGFYLGGHAGGFRSTTKTADTFAPDIFGGQTDSSGFIGGLQFGYNWRLAPLIVAGIEVDAGHMIGDGSFTCLQTATTIIGSDCRGEPGAVATMTARLGTLIDSDSRTLVYGKAGLAWMQSRLTMRPGNTMALDVPGPPPLSGDTLEQGTPVSHNITARGWVIGAGIERALDPAWSMKLEYAYHRFGNVSVATPETMDVTPGGVVTKIWPGTASVSQDMHTVKVGLNYNFSGYSEAAGAFAPPLRPANLRKDWAVEFGKRFWYSTGVARNDNSNNEIPIVSRLTYEQLVGYSGEFFGRIDAPRNLFLKGFVGLGVINKGRHYDEDWGLIEGNDRTAFEATESDISGDFKYATIDLGVTVLQGADFRVGVFGGYNYFRSVANAMGCSQLVNPNSGICSVPVPTTVNVVSQEDNWHSMRVGIAADAKLSEWLSVSADVAYVPYLFFRGVDTHRLRDPVAFFPSTATGRGVQAEVILNYHLTDALSLGIGARYWSMWTGTHAEHHCLNCTTAGSVDPMVPYKSSTERYGMFVQMSYRK